MARKRNLFAKAFVISLNLTALLTFTVALTTGGWITIQEPVQPEISPFYNEAAGTDYAPMLMYEEEISSELPTQCVTVSDAGLWSLCVRLVCTKNMTLSEGIEEPSSFFTERNLTSEMLNSTTNAIMIYMYI
ncbi:hypothetical protein CAPTEDRAFT_214645 [Capitella teleta]|uniref:Uncharacterized protein n=1 Tax=Capitella teleta TaxID=283909 RepID=R7UMJ4_CAPTE|nr:hypothetical protein CAPTEDRAFT_214645 [Capitella teleta]|eukprot:ELU05142.1 hypothetical protein CAPTEDRAFT_214645 [Capitella teleta]